MIAADLCLLVLFGLFVGYHAWQQAQWTAERARLTNALLARDPVDFMAMERQRVGPVPRAKPERDDEDSFEVVGMSG